MSALTADIVAGCARGLAGPTVRWVNCRPSSRQRVYFANHTSHLDFVVLWSVLPRSLREKTRPVAARDYWSSGLKKRLAVNAFNAVLVERCSKSAGVDCTAAARCTLELLLDALGTKSSLIIFPEGTRGSGLQVGAFKSGIFHLWQRRRNVQFVPVYLSNLNRVLPKGEFLPVPVISRVTFGAPLRIDPEETKESFLGKAHMALCRLKDV